MAIRTGTRLDARLGLNVPYEWWPGAAALKAIEAAGFAWVQVAAPPVGMLADPRHAVRHATALRRSLEVTDLEHRRARAHRPAARLRAALPRVRGAARVRAPDRRRAGRLPRARLRPAWRGVGRGGSRRCAGSRSRPRRSACGSASRTSARSIPGRSSVCHDPLSVRDLVKRLDTPAYGMLLDVGHAHVVAGFMGVETRTLLEPVLDVVRLFHVHDNLGAAARGGGAPVGRPAAARPPSAAGQRDAALGRDLAALLLGHERSAHDGDPPGPPAGPERPVGGRRDGPRAEPRALRSARAHKPGAARTTPDQLPYPARAMFHVRATPLHS